MESNEKYTRIHLLTPRGSVKSRKTWSGIPSGLSSSLERRGLLGETENEIGPGICGRWSNRLGKLPSPPISGLRRRLVNRDRSARIADFCRARPNEPVVLVSLTNFPLNRGVKNCCVLIDYPVYEWMQIQASEESASLDRRRIKYFNRWEKQCYHEAAHVFTLGEFCRERLIREFHLPEGKVSAIGTGTSFRPKLSNTRMRDFSKKRLFFLAKNREALKGCEEVANAFKKIHNEDPSATLTFAGSQLFIEKYAGRPGIKAIGYLEPGGETLENLFRDHNLFLMPSRSEPWGIVFLEALASGLPVLGLNANGFPEISRDGEFGFGIDRQDPDLIAQAIFEAFSAPSKLEQISRNAPPYIAEAYTWDRSCDKMINGLRSAGFPIGT